MPKLEFIVDHEPVAQPRPRLSAHLGRAKAYVPKSHRVHAWRMGVATAADQTLVECSVDPPWDVSVELEVEFFLMRPNRLKRKKDPQGPLWHRTKPDIDNLLKSLCDGLVQSNMLRDDNCIARLSASKHYCEKHGHPRARVVVRWPLEGENHEMLCTSLGEG